VYWWKKHRKGVYCVREDAFEGGEKKSNIRKGNTNISSSENIGTAIGLSKELSRGTKENLECSDPHPSQDRGKGKPRG